MLGEPPALPSGIHRLVLPDMASTSGPLLCHQLSHHCLGPLPGCNLFYPHLPSPHKGWVIRTPSQSARYNQVLLIVHKSASVSLLCTPLPLPAATLSGLPWSFLLSFPFQTIPFLFKEENT